MSVTERLEDDAIVTAAIKAYGAADAEVITQIAPERGTMREEQGKWFALGIREHLGGCWVMLGRRRSRMELLALAKRGSVDFRTCPKSP